MSVRSPHTAQHVVESKQHGGSSGSNSMPGSFVLGGWPIGWQVKAAGEVVYGGHTARHSVGSTAHEADSHPLQCRVSCHVCAISGGSADR